MRSLPTARNRLPHLAAWLLVVALVAGVSVNAAPVAYDNAVGLKDFTAAEGEAVRDALEAIHLAPVHLGWFWIVSVGLTNVVFVAMGWLLVRRAQPAGFATYLAIVMAAFGAASYPPDIPELYPGRPVLQAVILMLTVVAVSGYFILPLIFPDGRFVPRWTVLFALYVFSSFVFLWDQGGVFESTAYEIISTIVGVAIMLGAPVYRYRKVSTQEQRRQTRIVLLGFVIGLPCFFIGDAMMRNIDDSPMGIAFLFGFMILIQVGFNAPFVAVGVAILNHRLFDIDVILGRTLTWLAMTGAVIGAYVGIVLGVGSLLDTDDNLVLSLLATGLVAVAFQPVRGRVQRAVDRFVFGERDDPYAVLARLGHRIEDTLGAADLLPQIVRTTADALRLPYVALFLDRAGEPELVASAGHSTLSPLRLPLSYQGQPVGSLEVGQRAPGEAFSAADRRLLEDLARQIGIAAHTVSLAEELQRSREEIVASREEERRRLRRDLHDGLGAQLAALIMQAGAIKSQLRRDPVAAEQDLQELRDELKAAVVDVRRLVHGLRPPALDELGLAGTIRARLDRLQAGTYDIDGPGLEVRLDVREPLPHLPAAVEVAALHIVDEAVANVVRHARASRLSVSLVHHDDMLVVTIEDDGTGFRVERIVPGIGLQSMRERARELGGTWEMGQGDPNGGCVVRVALPARVETP